MGCGSRRRAAALFAAGLAAAFALPAAPALAQTVSSQSAPLIIDRERTDRTPPPAAPAQDTIAQPKPESELAQVQPFVLRGVRIEGTSLAPDLLGAASQPFIGRTVDAKIIGEIAQHISDAYADAGTVALYTVTVPAQNFSGGMLRVIVTEGYIQHVELHGDVSGDLSRAKALAQKLTLEKPLRRSTLERYLSLIRDLPGLTVEAKLLRGTQPGAVKLSLGLTQKRYLLNLTFNDAGNSLLGRNQIQADVSLYNLLREGEETVLSFGTSTLFNRYQYYALSHSEALTDEGTRATISYGYLHTRVPKLGLTGDAQTAQIALSHPLIRSYRENLSLTGSIDDINSTNALLGLAIADENVRAVRLSAGYSLSDKRSALALAASFNQGLGIFGARTNPLIANETFSKVVLQGSYNHLLGEEFVARLRSVAQLAFNRLPVSELYALGGPDFGRAFLSATALGDNAVAESVEIGFNPKNRGAFFDGTEFFVFADNGDTWYRPRLLNPTFHANLASAGLGIRLPIGEKLKLELQGANALKATAPGTKSGTWRFLFGLKATY